jgi:hypothetical protein
LDEEITMQFPDEPTWRDRARKMTRTYGYRLGPMLLVGALFAARQQSPWQSFGIFLLGALLVEGVLRVCPGKPRA